MSTYINARSLEYIFKDLDPALFQNVILGILSIFIPFAIVFLTDILNSKKEKRSEFEKMVLNDEVLGTKMIFLLSIGGISLFAFFSGNDIIYSVKILLTFIVILLILTFWSYFNSAFKSPTVRSRDGGAPTIN